MVRTWGRGGAGVELACLVDVCVFDDEQMPRAGRTSCSTTPSSPLFCHSHSQSVRSKAATVRDMM